MKRSDPPTTISPERTGYPGGSKVEIFGKGETGLESGGTGIDLYLVNTLVERYDSDVWVTDNTPESTVFTVKLHLDD